MSSDIPAVNYAEAIQFLYNLQMFGTKLGLGNTFKLAELAGNPQRKLRFIHVAGTNGKGSTCAMLESIYRAAGLKTGLFTSPHLVSFSERIQVNRTLVSERDVVRLVSEMRDLLKTFSPEAHPTFFEVVTVMALRYFAEQNCDIVIWETGMGGRLDATNIVTPLASVITNIQFDHEKWLGESIEKIASEKAGIIKSGVPVATAANDPAASRVISETAEKLNAPLKIVSPADTKKAPLEKIQLPLLGEHQRLNASLAIAVVHLLEKQIAISEEQIRRGLEQVSWPGRLQILQRGRTKILLDGAHNVAGAEALRDVLLQNFPGEKPTLIAGILRDKNVEKMCRLFADCGGKIIFVPVSSERTVQPNELVELCNKFQLPITSESCNSLAEALEKIANENFVVITGSLYLIGEALELLEKNQSQLAERKLNEWSGNPTR